MATAQKKTGTGGKRQASKTNKTSAGRKSSGTASAARQTSKKAQPQKPIRRGVGAVVCLALAIFAALGYFRFDGIVPNFLCLALEGIIGWGFYIAPLMLLWSSYILAFHRGRPVRLRVWCAMLLPVMLGAVVHLFAAKNAYQWDGALIPALWKDGIALEAGGVLSGVLAKAFQQFFSTAGAAAVFILLAILMALGACNRTLLDIVDSICNRPHLEYEYEEEDEYDEEEPTPVPMRVKLAAAKQEALPHREKAIHDYDLPAEDGPLLDKAAPEPEEMFEPQKRSFFDRTPRVRKPDEVLRAGKPEVSPLVAAEPEIEPETPAPHAMFAAADLHELPKPEPSITREPTVPKLQPEETAQAAAEVNAEAEASMAAASSAPAYQYPPLSLLKEGDDVMGSEAMGELQQNQKRLSETIRSFGIEANIAEVTRGPSVTRYELELDQGVRLNKLTNLADDIALALGASGVRIAPIPDKSSMVGIEVPNKLVSPVQIHTVIGSNEFCNHSSKVAFAVGKDIGGNPIVGNIAKLPHLLIAGTTGSGKSVCTNSLIISLLYKATPEEVRLIMVDPKMVELGIYNGIPHLLIPVVTDPKKAAGALQWAVTEMMKRYRTFSETGVRDLASFNSVAAKTEGLEKMPQIVVVIDELADLMLVAAKEVEESICRIAQMGRASGIHLIIATQRPSADVITGLMKANIPSRIAFAVASALESRIILDTQGAEKLVGRGDMLFAPVGSGKPLRVQGCLISDEEVANVVAFVKKSGQAEYSEEILHEIDRNVAEKEKGGKGVGGGAVSADEGGGDYDELLPSAIDVVLETGMASVSMLQRRLKLGYSRAARLVDQMEEKGIVGPFEGSKPRQVLITKAQWQELQYREGFQGDTPVDAPRFVEQELPDAEEPDYNMAEENDDAPF